MERVLYKKSFSAKLILAGTNAIDVYSKLKEACLSRKKVSNRLSFDKESIKYGKNKIGLIRIARKNLSLYLAIKPDDIDNEKYKFEYVGDKKSYIDYPIKLNLKSKRSLKLAIELLNNIFDSYDAKITKYENINYHEVFYDRTFDELLNEGLIKKYVYRKIDNKTVLVEEKPDTKNVTFTVKLLYCAENKANNLYIISNYTNWDFKKAIKMDKVNPNLYTKTVSYPTNYNLEFKICRAESFLDVEKGIWKEEIVNHHYVVSKDLEVEDLIHNFRNN